MAGAAGLALGLCGQLGAGKSVFVRGLAEGMGIDPGLVTSPTFVLIHEYPPGPQGRLVHADLYRLEDEAELEVIGFFELLASPAMMAVEWADRFRDVLPSEHIELRLSRPGGRPASRRGGESDDPDTRCIEVVSHGSRVADVVARWMAQLAKTGSVEVE